MTTFKDGPARGATLQLRRAPFYLRVVMDGVKVDALDQTTDFARHEEKIFAYRMAGAPGWCHVRASKGCGGTFRFAEYELVPDQPSDKQMRARLDWHQWWDAALQRAAWESFRVRIGKKPEA